ncbi:MAG: YceI family protein [Acidimicrobiia bacterium]|nr:YceI family protein [Acidimicrobiia bacterium]
MARYTIDPEASQVWVAGTSSVHPIHATATGLEGWIDVEAGDGAVAAGTGLAGEVRIAVAALRSGNGLVDRETRRRIDARRHPEITGVVTGSDRVAGDRLSLRGDLTFRGETRQVEGEVGVVVDDGGERIVLEGSQSFDVRDWGLEPPRFAMLKVHPGIDVRVHVEARRA